jgi:hypothetical protein
MNVVSSGGIGFLATSNQKPPFRIGSELATGFMYVANGFKRIRVLLTLSEKTYIKALLKALLFISIQRAFCGGCKWWLLPKVTVRLTAQYDRLGTCHRPCAGRWDN